MPDVRLVERSVREFVEAVASAEQPVPAGGSVSALTGAASAALLALVCDVLERHKPGELESERRASLRLQKRLLELVDEDADGFRAYLAARRSSGAVYEAAKRVAATPVEVGQACLEIIDLSARVEQYTSGGMLGDVRAARHLAQAAIRTSIDLAEQNVALQEDPSELKAAIAELREKLSA